MSNRGFLYFVLLRVASVGMLLITQFAHAEGLSRPPAKRFSQLSPTLQKAYMHDVRQAVFELEKAQRKAGIKLADGVSSAGSLFEMSLVSNAIAAEKLRYCVIGGIERSMVKNGETYVCPTSGRECKGRGTFRCGLLGGGACVSIIPTEEISQKCFESGEKAMPTLALYKKYREEIERINTRTCPGAQQEKSPCDYFQKSIASLDQHYGLNLEKESATAPTGAVPVSATFPVDTHAISCSKKNEGQYKKIMDALEKCVNSKGVSGATSNSIDLYIFLAKIASCSDYTVEKITAFQDSSHMGLDAKRISTDKSCLVDLEDPDASMGSGHIDIKFKDSEGGLRSIKWDAKQDSTGRNNNTEFWRYQLMPQINDIIAHLQPKSSAEMPDTGRSGATVKSR